MNQQVLGSIPSGPTQKQKNMHFEGDIIITDPCYIVPDKPDMWRNGSINVFNGTGIEKFGVKTYIWDSTIYGDWSCTTFKLKASAVNKHVKDITADDIDGEDYGNFCADAGLVGVFLLKEVLAFNPNFDYHENKPWTTTLIKDFSGEVEYIVYDDEVFIKGSGSHNFITRQTGL